MYQGFLFPYPGGSGWFYFRIRADPDGFISVSGRIRMVLSDPDPIIENDRQNVQTKARDQKNYFIARFLMVFSCFFKGYFLKYYVDCKKQEN